MERSYASGARKGFAKEVEVLVSIATKLGRCHREGAREEFVRSLMAMDFSRQQAELYWDCIDRVPAKNGAVSDASDLSHVASNTQLAYCLGILLDSRIRPRCELVYRLLEHHFPGFFSVEISGTQHMGGKESRGNPEGRRIVRFPRQPGRVFSSNGGIRVGKMPAYEVYQGKEPSRFSEQVLRVSDPLRNALGNDLGLQLTNVLVSCNMEIPSVRTAKALAPVIHAGLRGETVTLAGAFCPDYAYEETGDPQIPYRYTFDGLGEGVGLVARQFARILPVISSFLSDLGITHKIVIGIGDFEADSEAVLQQVNVDRKEFIRRCQSSLDAFRSTLRNGMQVELELFGEERSKGRLRPYAEFAIAEMMSGRFGLMSSLHEHLDEVLARIPGQYRTFYERWYGRAMEDLEVSSIVLQQGAEYSAVARIYYEDLGRNLILLAGDRPEMNRFNAFYTVVPTLCARRAY